MNWTGSLQARVLGLVVLVTVPALGAAGEQQRYLLAAERLLRALTRSNALKFSSARTRARIEVGAHEQDGELAFFVRDDGIGFDQGEGIGLATAQRIIRLHGGRIWPDASVERGATAYFTLAERP